MPSLSLPLLAAAALSGAVALQPPGQFHGDEPVARDGETWLALRASGERAGLSPTRLRVQAVEDPLLDEAGQTSGRRVTSALEPDHEAPGNQIVAYLRGSGLAAGAVVAARIDRRSEPGAVPAYQLQHGGQRYEIRTACTPQRSENASHDCRILLRGAGGEQTLARMAGREEGGKVLLGDDAAPALLFAGDVDRDGKLDLIFDLSDHYNVSRPTLFLSSRARDGELLHAASHYESVGC
ncbi:MAG: hypothetical protein HOQ32_02175 [Lysobacter sp.]|nr:hypothetical protein [Lysobacter sp.]